ncbi:hypothetical protein D3C86_1446660 [compost metagenome]
MTREDFLRNAEPHLIADVRMYATADGGRKTPAHLGWGCPCMVSLEEPLEGWDAWPILLGEPLKPGDERRLGMVFLSGEKAATIMRDAGHFFLWEGRAIGEAKVIA